MLDALCSGMFIVCPYRLGDEEWGRNTSWPPRVHFIWVPWVLHNSCPNVVTATWKNGGAR